jgi:hypothetical protein
MRDCRDLQSDVTLFLTFLFIATILMTFIGNQTIGRRTDNDNFNNEG